MDSSPGESLGNLLDVRGRQTPEETAFIWEGRPYSWGWLRERTGYCAEWLLARGLAAGDRILVGLPNGPDFLTAFFGVQRAGGVPVPLSAESGAGRFADIAEHAQARMIVVSPRTGRERFGDREGRRRLTGSGCSIVSVADAVTPGPIRSPVSPRPEDTCFIQYTSGSTGDPKGVVLSYANVRANIESLITGMAISPRDVFVNWLPLYHDMGLVLMTMVPLFIAARLVLLPNRLGSGRAWLGAIERYGGSFTAAPDFAYRFCLRHVRNPESFSLKSLRVALNAAEPVRARTVEEFEARFGLKDVVRPGYGLAEATVGVSMWPPGRPVRYDGNGRVSVGPPFPGVEVRIVAGGRILSPGETGEIQVRSASTTSGYFNSPAATSLLMAGAGFIHTGDLGFLDSDGNLYLVGRTKEVIINAGRNIAPAEVEEAVDTLPFVRLSAATGVDRGGDAGEETFVFAEVSPARAEGLRGEEMARAVAGCFQHRFGFRPGRVYLLAPHTIPRTPNGKIQRGLLRTRYLEGTMQSRGHILYPVSQLPGRAGDRR